MRRKRPYVPKVKGCYECSQRRIDCDRAEPKCAKCLSKGLHCSGLGAKRIRFADEVSRASRGRQKPSRNDEISRFDATAPESFVSPLEVAPSGSLEAVNGLTQFLLEYFSSKIAPEMTVIDDKNNGWRCIILPTAQVDDLVQLSVAAAAALHFQRSTCSLVVNAAAVHAHALQELRKRQDLVVQSTSQQQGVLLALLVLLAADMIQGTGDFRSIFSLIDKAIMVVGGEDQVASGQLGTFLIRQIRKYRGYASPMVSQAQGIMVLSQTTPTKPSTSKGWEDFRQYYKEYSPRDQSLAIMYDLNTLACSMYVRRAQRGRGGRGLATEVELVRQNLDALPTNCPCEHALIWPTFIAALESETIEHQDYFRKALQRHHERNGFANILVALNYLEERWKDGVVLDWTRSLPDLPAFVV